MTMSEKHICFRMLCFHVNQARFTVSADYFMTVSFLTYDVVRLYEIDREHVAASESISGVPRGWFGVFKPPPPEIPKLSVKSSIA